MLEAPSHRTGMRAGVLPLETEIPSYFFLLLQIFLLHPPSMLRRRLSELEALDERVLYSIFTFIEPETLRLESAKAFFLALSLFFVLPLVTPPLF